MARVAIILAAIGRAVRREVGTFGSLGGNNFVFFIALMMYGAAQSGVEPKSSYPPLLFLLIVLMFPLSSDPLEKIPASRLGLWPLTPSERVQLRALSILLSPVLWIAAALFVFKRIRPAIAIAFLTALIGVQVIAMVARSLLARAPRFDDLKLVPPLPGKLGGLVRNNVRQIFQVLDFYIALILAAGACAYRAFAAKPEPEAFPILSVMIALTLSTYAQVLFGLDRTSSALTRYRLFPLHGWQVLLAKDIAFLAVLLVLVLPVDPLPGLAFGLFALAAGHHASVLEKIPLRHWRFSGGRAFIGVVQCVGGFMLGISTHRVSPLYAAAAAGLYAVSLAFYGWRLGKVHVNGM